MKDDEGPDLRDLFGRKADAEPGDDAKVKPAEEDRDDVRTVSPVWDSRNRRYRPWRDVRRNIT